MNMQEAFDSHPDIKDLNRIVKEGKSIEQLEAKAKLRYALHIWKICWPIAFEQGIAKGSIRRGTEHNLSSIQPIK